MITKLAASILSCKELELKSMASITNRIPKFKIEALNSFNKLSYKIFKH